MGKKSRDKGAAFEREIVQSAKAAGFDGAYREAPLQAGSGTRFADVGGVGWLRIECKRRARGSLAAGKEHVLGVEAPGFMRASVCRDDHEPALCVMRWDDVLKLVFAARKAMLPNGMVAEMWASPRRIGEGSCLVSQPYANGWEDGHESATEPVQRMADHYVADRDGENGT